MKFTNSLVIRRQPADVFGFLADPENIPKWNYAIASTRQITPGEIRVGTRFQQRRTLPRPAEEELEVTEIAPNRRLVLQGDLGPLHGSLAYELEEVPDGTRLTNVADLKAGGPVGFVAELAGGRVQAAVADNLGVLKRILEHADEPSR
jgi:uncharacterized protein YndB with AHSA1/START domain